MQEASEEASLRSLRMFLRDKVLLKLLNDKKWSPFSKPLQSMYPDTAFSYPMDLSTMLWNLDEGRYPTVDSFKKDMHAIVIAMKEFVENDVEAARIVSRAHALEDTVDAILSGYDVSIIQKCDEIAKRGGPVRVNSKGKAYTSSAVDWRQAADFRPERTSSRIRGAPVERHVIFQDPEQQAKMIREQKRQEQAAAAAAQEQEQRELEAAAAAAPTAAATGVKECDAGEQMMVAAVEQDAGKTPAQVLIRWSLQRGYVTLPKSTNPGRIEQNAAVFGFELTPEQMGRLDGLDRHMVTGWDPTVNP